MYLDVVADDGRLLLERIPPAPPRAAPKGLAEDIVKVEALAPEAAASTKAPETREWTARSSEWVTTAWAARPSVGVESGSAKLVILLLLLGV